jgi:hypothetical protein
MVVSKSEADAVSCPLVISNRKLSKIGKVLLVFSTPEILCRCFKRLVLEAMKFILINLDTNLINQTR